MGFFNRLFGHEQRAITPQPTPPRPADLLPGIPYFSGMGFNDSNIPVSEELSLTLSAVWCAVSCISNAFSSLPAHVLDRKTGEKRIDHPVYTLLHDEPNDYMTAATFKDAMMANVLLWGAGYAYIEKDVLGNPIGLYPLLARYTAPVRHHGTLVYQTLLGDKTAIVDADCMLHVLGMSFDGINGLNVIQYARQTIGVSVALERFAAKFFGSGANVGGLIEAPTMSPEAQRDFVEKWRRAYTSIDGAFKIAALPPGVKFTQTTTDPEKAQAVESRVHQIREIARIFHVPPHKLMDLERATFSNIEHQSIEFMQEAIQPWAIRWEQEAGRKLFSEREKPYVELRFNLDSLLRADTASRYSAHAVALNSGFCTVNEIRAREGLPPVKNGDILRTPLNMAPVSNTAARGLVEDVARRAITKEIRALQRAQKKYQGKPDELRAWATTWYATHEALIARSFAPVLRTLACTTTPADYAKAHCAESMRAIVTALDGKASVDDLIDDFEDRPAVIADELTQTN
ncbi:MAG: phage portal protein [Bacillota bacterium]